MTIWVAVMARHPDEGEKVVRFPEAYFDWLKDQVFSIQDFPYSRMDFRGDPDMVLPQGEQWDDRGIFTFHSCFNLSIFLFLNIISKLIVKFSKCRCRPTASSRSPAF